MDDKEVTQYYLRHTFATVCQQYVRPDIVDIWMGDSSERLVGRVYTHFSDDFMLKQMQKVVFDLWCQIYKSAYFSCQKKPSYVIHT